MFWTLLTLQVDEFIRRFLQHTLPTGFVRIRYYGLLANRYRALNLARCRTALGVEVDLTCENDILEHVDWVDLFETLTGQNLRECPKCKRGKLCLKERLFPKRPKSLIHSRAPPIPQAH